MKKRVYQHDMHKKVCPHFEQCSGCVYPFLDTPPEIYKEAKKYFASHQIGLSLEKGRGVRYRSKLAVRGEKLGLFYKDSHDVIEIPECYVHHPALNLAFKEFKRLFLKSTLQGYDEKTHRGDIRYIQGVVERKTEKVQLTIVLKNKHVAYMPLCTELYETGLFHSIWINIQKEKTNVIFGKEWSLTCGEQFLVQRIGNVDIPFLPSHFCQAPLDMFDLLLQDIQAHIKQDSQVLELYGGSGSIGLNVAHKAKSVVITERDREAEDSFQKAVEAFPYKEKVSFCVADAANALTLFQKRAGVLIVDPPRKGLSSKIIEMIPDVEKLIYVSCNFSSFQRDVAHLMQKGFIIQAAKSYLFFPGTNHIELCALFGKK